MKRSKSVEHIVLLSLSFLLMVSGWPPSDAQVRTQREEPRPMLTASQQAQQPIERKLAATQITPNMVKVNSRAPIAFHQIPLIDPKTRKQVAPDYVLTLPDGKRVKAGDFYAELNKIEQDLNQRGYSLRNMPDKLVLQESIVPSQALQVRTLAIREAAVRPRARVPANQLATRVTGVETAENGQRVLRANELTSESVSAARARAGTATMSDKAIRVPTLSPGAPPPPPAKPKLFHRETPWDWSVGSPSSFQAYIRGKLITDMKAYPLANASNTELYKSNTEASLSANGEAGGSILGKSADLVRANASFYAPANTSKPLNAKMSISVLGATVYNFNKDFGDKWSTSDTLSYKLSVGVPFGVPIGPVVIGGVIGAKGSAGFSYGVSLTRAGVSGNVNPFVHTAVYGEGGASVIAGGAGVGVEMTMINGDLHLFGKFTLGWFLKWMIFDELYADYEIDLLSGRAYGFVYVWYPCDWIGPIPTDFCKKQWEHNFWKWSGFKTSGVLVEHKDIIAFDKW